MLVKSHSRAHRLNTLLGLGLIGNLSWSVGLLPWLTLSAHGQAMLLETNPIPQTPSFEIPSEVSPAAESVPEVAYEPAPESPAPEYYSAPEPYTPEPYVSQEAPEPYIAPTPYVDPEPYIAPEPYHAPEPIYEPPATVAQQEPAVLSPAPASGCAALLDPTMSLDVNCGSSPGEIASPVEVAPPVIPQPIEQIVTEQNIGPDQGTIPPARQVQRSTVASPAVPPARRLTAAIPKAPSLGQNSGAAPSQLPPPVPSYSNSALTAAPAVASIPGASVPVITPVAPRDGNGIVTAVAPGASSRPSQDFTTVKLDRYGLTPLNSKNPLTWILGGQTMLFPLPIPVAVSSAFGWRQHPIQQHWHLHSGIDFAAAPGTPVLAAYDGQVAIADKVGGYGLSVLLSHNQGQRQTRYAHLSEIFVRPGQRVSQGDVLGSVGSTGNSTGPHLHFETLVKTPEGMVVVDPTEEVKTALINTLSRMQKIAQQGQQSELTPSPDASRSRDGQSAPSARSEAPIAVDVIQPMSRYQANINLSVPNLSE